MKILYTLSALVALTGYSYRNPQHFLRPERDATEVLIDGDYPNITKAYGDLGINVSQYVAETNTNQSSGDDNLKPPKQKELTVEQIKALLTEKGIHFDTKANKPELLKLLEDFQNSGDGEGEGDSSGDNENTGNGEDKGTGEGDKE